jgi:glyoxylase-like metal-dependent hydrolase (beta-lactamase superfamily II)
MDSSISIHTFTSGPYATNSYLVTTPGNKEALLIDCPPGVTRKLIQYLQEHGMQLTKIVLTHSHWDHIADAAQIIKQTDAPLFVHQEDAYNVIAPGSDGLPSIDAIQAVTPSKQLVDGDDVSVGSCHFKVIHTPGHSPGSICLYSEQEHLLFSGDTLFKRSIGNLSFPTSQSERMWPSLQRLSTLPIDTKVFPGHGESTTIGHEKWLANAQEIFG